MHIVALDRIHIVSSSMVPHASLLRSARNCAERHVVACMALTLTLALALTLLLHLLLLHLLLLLWLLLLHILNSQRLIHIQTP